MLLPWPCVRASAGFQSPQHSRTQETAEAPRVATQLELSQYGQEHAGCRYCRSCWCRCRQRLGWLSTRPVEEAPKEAQLWVASREALAEALAEGAIAVAMG